MKITLLQPFFLKILSGILIVFFIFSPIKSFAENHNEDPSLGDVAADAAEGAVIGVASCYLAGFAGNLLGGLSTLLSVPTGDSANQANTGASVGKNCMLDGAANGIKRGLVKALVRSTVNWINGGFDGSPRFGYELGKIVEDTKAMYLDEIIYNNKNLNFLCSGFELPLKFAMQVSYGGGGGDRYQPKCTIDDIKTNVGAAVDDLDDYYSVNRSLAYTTNSSNSPFGVYFKLSNDLDRAVKLVVDANDKELSDNGGFLSYRKCNQSVWEKAWVKENKDSVESGVILTKPNFSIYDGSYLAKKHCKITTPGTTLSASLNKSLEIEGDALVSADEFDEVISSLVGYAVRSATGSGGVSGLTGGGSGSQKDIVDPNLPGYKKSYAKKYDTRAYDIVLKILGSRKTTAESTQQILDDTVTCWNDIEALKTENDKKGNKNYFRLKSSEDGSLIYEILTSRTIASALQHSADFQSYQKEEIKITTKKIEVALSDRAKAKSLVELINNASDFLKLEEIISNARVGVADIFGEEREKTEKNRILDEMVNGSIGGYDQFGSIRVGGLGATKNYCSSFNLDNTPTAAKDESISFVDSVSNASSIISTAADISFVDTYNLTVDVRNLESN
jgi:hypothetical protein